METITLPIDVCGAALSRRRFVKTGGALVVGMAALGGDLLAAPAGAQAIAPSLPKHTPNAALAGAWFEIRVDNTMAIHTGKSDFGQSSVTTAYRQIVAEELNVPYDAITTVVMGDTDRTPDGGVSAGFLHRGGANLRKAAAYTQQALLEMAATQLGVPKQRLRAKDGMIAGGGKSITYGALVAGQELTLAIPVQGDLTTMNGLTVTGNPPFKPVSQYGVVGRSFTNFVTESKVRGTERWITSVNLPGMLHARVLHPKTLGSTLLSVGAVDKARFPHTQVVVRGNLVGVVAPTEWEAIRASQEVASATRWSEWSGLPGHAGLPQALRRADWGSVPPVEGKSQGRVDLALAGATKVLRASYDLPYWKHAPIGPTIAIADARPDGMVYLHVHNQNTSMLRGQIARMLGVSMDFVVVRSYTGPGHYGRSNGGNSGGEDEAVILSMAVGKPVRVQWMRPEDLAWSTASPASYSDVEIGLDAQGRIVGASFDHRMPAFQDDRPIGAVLAGLPTMAPPDVDAPPDNPTMGSIANAVRDPWLYDRVANVRELAYGTFQIGQKQSPIAVGIRDHTMRTPGQYQQNFPREMAMSQAAALAGVDPIEFRMRHTSERRLLGVLDAVRDASGWQSRATPSPKAAVSGGPVSGQGVSVMFRGGTYWACVCQITVNPATGEVKVDRYTMAVDPGIVINPLQLKRQIEGGALMGISHTLYEELRFDESGVTSRDWRTYPIATMADVPEVKVVIVSNLGVGEWGGGSEAANASALSAIGAAFYDATGKVPTRLPLRPDYVRTVLRR